MCWLSESLSGPYRVRLLTSIMCCTMWITVLKICAWWLFKLQAHYPLTILSFFDHKLAMQLGGNMSSPLFGAHRDENLSAESPEKERVDAVDQDIHDLFDCNHILTITFNNNLLYYLEMRHLKIFIQLYILLQTHFWNICTHAKVLSLPEGVCYSLICQVFILSLYGDLVDFSK